jgi:hypothetical protein
MEKKILILTDKLDMHPSSVINLMKEQNIPFFRLNTESLMTDYDFAWFHKNAATPDFYIKDRNNGKIIWGHEIWSVWYRKPGAPESLPFCINQEIDRHNLTEGKQFFIYLMYYLSDIYSMGNHLWDKRANSKMVQSQLAVELGMEIAPTCISNNKEDIVEFSNQFDSISLKSLRDHNVMTTDGKVYHLSTLKVASNQLMEQPEESFSQTVVFAQQYIEKKYELRVTVMGSHIFTCKLDSQALTASTGAVDWRDGYDYGLKHEMIDTPTVIGDFCRKYLQRLCLNFGCFDFIVKPNGEYVFLECNPNGQWGWIEDECHVPMSEAMVDCLVNKLQVNNEHA